MNIVACFQTPRLKMQVIKNERYLEGKIAAALRAHHTMPLQKQKRPHIDRI